MEELIDRMNGAIKDPDLFRLFENSYPNTPDAMIKWRGFANKFDSVAKNATFTDEELTYVTTGDIDAKVATRFGVTSLQLPPSSGGLFRSGFSCEPLPRTY